MAKDVFAEINNHLTAAQDHLQQSGLGTYDSGNHIYTAIYALTEAVKLLAKEAKDADKAIYRMSQP